MIRLHDLASNTVDVDVYRVDGGFHLSMSGTNGCFDVAGMQAIKTLIEEALNSRTPGPSYPYKFIPADELFRYSRANYVVAGFIPQYPKFTIKRTVVSLDVGWLDLLGEECRPWGTRGVLDARRELVIQYLKEFNVLPQDLDKFSLAPVNEGTLGQINSYAMSYDREREYNRRVTYRELWQHMLGVNQSYLIGDDRDN